MSIEAGDLTTVCEAGGGEFSDPFVPSRIDNPWGG